MEEDNCRPGWPVEEDNCRADSQVEEDNCRADSQVEEDNCRADSQVEEDNCRGDSQVEGCRLGWWEEGGCTAPSQILPLLIQISISSNVYTARVLSQQMVM